MTIRVHHYIEKHGLPVCKHCGYVRSQDTPYSTACSGRLPSIETRGHMDSYDKLKADYDRLKARETDAAAIAALAMRVANHGGSLVCTSSLTPEQIAIAHAAGRMVVVSDGTGFVYVPGPKVPTP